MQQEEKKGNEAATVAETIDDGGRTREFREHVCERGTYAAARSYDLLSVTRTHGSTDGTVPAKITSAGSILQEQRSSERFRPTTTHARTSGQGRCRLKDTPCGENYCTDTQGVVPDIGISVRRGTSSVAVYIALWSGR